MAGSIHPACICPDLDCPRHGLCAVCNAFHKQAGTLPKCEREQPQADKVPPPRSTKDTDYAEKSSLI